MKNYLKIFIDSKPISTPVNFGINENVIFNKVDIKERLTKKGEKSKFNCYLEFLKLNKDGKSIGRSEYSFFMLDAKDLEKTEETFNKQFNKLLHLAAELYDNDEELEEAVAEAYIEIYGDTGMDIDDEADELFKFNSKTNKKNKPKKKELEKLINALQNNINIMFKYILSKKAGIDNSPRLYLLSVVDKDGYPRLPFEKEFVSTEKGVLKIDPYYLEVKKKSEKRDEPDIIDNSISDSGDVEGLNGLGSDTLVSDFGGSIEGLDNI